LFLHHFERLSPVCPLCRLSRGVESPLAVGQIARQDEGEIIEGYLLCTNRSCLREHPIIDGIPVILADAPSWLANQIHYVLRRDDLSDFTMSLLGDLAGQSSALDRDRGNNGIYAHAHWAQDQPGYLSLFRAAMQLLTRPPTGVWLDIGCSLGRGSFELAKLSGDLVVGLDLNFSMLRMAQKIRRSNRVEYHSRRVGLVFDSHDYPLPDYPAHQVGFWCADVSILPFPGGTFAGALCMNMLDCVPSPLGLLFELGRVTLPSSESILCTPFDWAAGATEPAAWIGGHSQRSTPEQGSSVAELRRFLSVNNEAGIDTGVFIEAELDNVKWRLRLNERAVTEYDVYCARLRHKA
jgi:SAM-dependent methyltransferase/uncharacterized protein YbaR (Trm112 family)